MANLQKEYIIREMKLKNKNILNMIVTGKREERKKKKSKEKRRKKKQEEREKFLETGEVDIPRRRSGSSLGGLPGLGGLGGLPKL